MSTDAPQSPTTDPTNPLSTDEEVSQILKEAASEGAESSESDDPPAESGTVDDPIVDPQPEGDDSADDSSTDPDDSPTVEGQLSLADIDRTHGTEYAAGDAADGWRQVNENLRLAKLVGPHLTEFQEFLTAKHAKAQPEPVADPSPAQGELPPYNFKEWGKLTSESPSHLLAGRQDYNEKLIPLLDPIVRGYAGMVKKIEALEGQQNVMSDQARQVTQREHNMSAHQQYLTSHPELSVDGDPGKGRTDLGKAFDLAIQNPTYYDDKGQLRMDAEAVFDASYGRAIQQHPTALTPKPAADAPREPHPSALHQPPITKPDAESNDELFRKAVQDMPENASVAKLLEQFAD